MRTAILKRRVRGTTRRPSKVLALAAVLTAATAGVANASAPNPGFRTETAVFDAAGQISSTLSDNFFVGDCTQFMNSSIFLSRPAPDGTVSYDWHAFALTSHTNNADIWHGTFTFQTAFGTTIATVGPRDGLRMTQINQVYTWDDTGTIRVDPALYPAIRKVVWRGAC